MSPTLLVWRAGSTRCRVSSLSYSGSFPSWSAVAPWPALLPVYPTSAGSTVVPAGASKPYSRRMIAPCSGLTPSVPEVCLCWVSALPSSAAVPRCGRGGSAVLGPPIGTSLLSSAPCALGALVVGVFPSPPRPRPSSRAVGHPGVLSPRSNSTTPGVLAPCGDSTPPPTLWQYLHVFSANPEALRPPLSPRTPKILPDLFSCRITYCPLCAVLAPWRPCAPASSAAAERAFPVSPTPDHAPPCSACTRPGNTSKKEVTEIIHGTL